MRIRTIRLREFKRFDDLTIDLGEHPRKIVALVGPNGSGKSSVFDAFEQLLQDHVHAPTGMDNSFFSKRWYSATNPSQAYNKHEAISITTAPPGPVGPKSFYVRSAYRYTSRLRVDAIKANPDVITDGSRPGSSIGLDQRLQGNYERLLGRLLQEFWRGEKTGEETRTELIGRINTRLANVLDVRITDLGNVSEGKGQLFFEKGTSKNFPFENLSAGEKEVVDMMIDLEVKLTSFDDTVFCIDEPELHLNTAVQRKLLSELAAMIPDSCQLWVATHSIGFLRALQQDLAGESQILDFSEKEYFAGTQTITPIAGRRSDWKRIFGTALEDLSGLVAPQVIVYCEGRPDPSAAGAEQGLDAHVYNTVFEDRPEVFFVSSGGGGAQVKNSGLALAILTKAFDGVVLRLLKDRDELSDAERAGFLAESSANRMLSRREIENFLCDPAVLELLATAQGTALDRAAYDALVNDITTQDLKLGQTLQKLKALVGFAGTIDQFKRTLALHVRTSQAVYAELAACVI